MSPQISHSWRDDGKAKFPMGLVIGLCVGFGLIMLLALFGFYRYRQKKIAKSRKQKATIQQAQDELQAFKESVVNMRVVVEAAAPGGGAAANAPPAAPSPPSTPPAPPASRHLAVENRCHRARQLRVKRLPFLRV